MASDSIFIINPALPIRNGLVVIQPQPGQLASGVAPTTGQGLGGYILSHRVPDEREQDFTNIDGYSAIIGGRYLEQADPHYRPTVPATPADYASSGANNLDTVLTYPAAGVGRCHVLGGVSFGYSAPPSPSGCVFKIEDGSGVVVYRELVTTTGVQTLEFEPPKRFSPNTSLILTLNKGGAAVSGDISVLQHWTV